MHSLVELKIIKKCAVPEGYVWRFVSCVSLRLCLYKLGSSYHLNFVKENSFIVRLAQMVKWTVRESQMDLVCCDVALHHWVSGFYVLVRYACSGLGCLHLCS